MSLQLPNQKKGGATRTRLGISRKRTRAGFSAAVSKDRGRKPGPATHAKNVDCRCGTKAAFSSKTEEPGMAHRSHGPRKRGAFSARILSGESIQKGRETPLHVRFTQTKQPEAGANPRHNRVLCFLRLKKLPGRLVPRLGLLLASVFRPLLSLSRRFFFASAFSRCSLSRD